MMTKFAVFDACSKLAYAAFPQATESVAVALAVSLVSGMIGKTAESLLDLRAPRRSCFLFPP